MFIAISYLKEAFILQFIKLYLLNKDYFKIYTYLVYKIYAML